MKSLQNLFDRIIQRVNINLRELNYDVTPYIENILPFEKLLKFYAFYGITPHHPLNFVFRQSNLAGSYFLGRCRVSNSILYKSDIRGDELKKEGQVVKYDRFDIKVSQDEAIHIEDSILVKTLVHNFSHDPESLEQFFISNTISAHYANIHGSPTDGSFLGPMATVDLTTMNDCVIGAFAYVQAGEISHLNIDPGTVWVRVPGVCNFLYHHPSERLSRYIFFAPNMQPQGLLMDFVEKHKAAFQKIFEVVNIVPTVEVPQNASVDRFAVVEPKTRIGENVLVAQRAYLQNCWLGKGANAQENCHIINSRLEGNNVTAHGAKIIEADMGENVFVGFNSFLHGRPGSRLTVGKECIVMPHTIIDIDAPLTVPAGHLAWGMINNQADLEANSISLANLSKVNSNFSQGNMVFEGSGAAFVEAFKARIHHILEANGAFYDGVNNKGHAQKNQNISFNTIQPYPEGDLEGVYPTILIQP
ncbi:MAG: transferase [Desulfatitalea sp.]|nr:transferase [Desulfatitalea sp.]NNK01243.1 transferase [Desulfatitalea sp.]